MIQKCLFLPTTPRVLPTHQRWKVNELEHDKTYRMSSAPSKDPVQPEQPDPEQPDPEQLDPDQPAQPGSLISLLLHTAKIQISRTARSVFTCHSVGRQKSRMSSHVQHRMVQQIVWWDVQADLSLHWPLVMSEVLLCPGSNIALIYLSYLGYWIKCKIQINFVMFIGNYDLLTSNWCLSRPVYNIIIISTRPHDAS